jgi:transcriptional regulator with XRE-family HTH domain
MEVNPLKGHSVGVKIKKVRELKNLTQEYLAEQVGMTTSGYSRIERGEVKISLDRLQQVAMVLGVQPNDLTNFDESASFTKYGTANDNSFSIRADKALLQQVIATFEARIADLKDEIQFFMRVLKV